MKRIKSIVKKTFDPEKMLGARILTRDLFLMETGHVVTLEVIVILITTIK